ncbi:MAG: sulfite exporter TauE/SafE family protein [Chloroflexi bacterium]|nr:sulfite exporter TauE/SafE family protein [Chloroflexota bacterium]
MRATVSQTQPTRSIDQWLFKPLRRALRLDLLIVAAVGAVAALLLATGVLAPTVSPGAAVRSDGGSRSQQEMVASLTRYGLRPEGTHPEVSALLVTRELVAGSGNEQILDGVKEPSLLLYLSEENHDDLPLRAPEPLLGLAGGGLDGSRQRPADVRVLSDSPHHRALVVRYSLTGSLAHLSHGMGERLELVFSAPAGSSNPDTVLTWDLPLRYGAGGLPANPVLTGQRDLAGPASVASGSSLSLAIVLGMFGGMLASMWPCLFQLTVYFIPSLAGLSLAQETERGAPGIQRQVLKTAGFFVAGIVIVYTAAGAIIGLAAQSFSGTEVFQTWQRPVSAIAALVMIGMAVRVAIRARAPLVCKMPFLSHVGGKGAPGPVGTMLMGLAFATGCMTCFGSALVLGFLMYTVSSASMLTGALLLFFFSLGISIPLVGAALLLARLLPLLDRLERVAPWMALASSAIMIAFAVLLLTGQYHAVSGVFVRTVIGG